MSFGYRDESWINPIEDDGERICTIDCEHFHRCPCGCGEVFCDLSYEWVLEDEVCIY